MELPLWLVASFWGFVSGSALLLGALVAYFKKVPKWLTALIMAFGSGVLIAALAFELMEEAYRSGGFDAAAVGFISGALLYSGANYLLNERGARHRKRSAGLQANERDSPGGVSLLHGGAVSRAAVVAIFLSNVPEALSSTAGMKRAGRSARFIFGIWGAIAVLSGVAALVGYAVFRNFPPDIIAGTIAVAAGGILAMLSSTMIPEAYEEAHDLVGIVTVIGFLTAFILSKTE
ncbi:MAG: ZIP family zinc transporter [Chitinophagaceae bacterium]|nr:MAG: ZIP family zinc transporter [Chitinophagaceae bacterium]